MTWACAVLPCDEGAESHAFFRHPSEVSLGPGSVLAVSGTVGLVDFHSHLVPAVDDGSRSLEEALDGVRRLRGAGVTRIITTPHFRGSLTKDPGELQRALEVMDAGWEEICQAVSKEWPDMDFRRGHEVLLDIPDPDLSDERLRLGGTKSVLVEWPRFQVPPGTPQVLASIVASGLIPVVAHPERYSGIDRHLQVVRQWKDAGAYLQGNHGSLTGRYGSGPQGLIQSLLAEGLLDYLSSDFHGRPHLQPLVQEAQEAMSEMDGEGAFQLLASTNAGRLLDGEPPLPVPPVLPDPSLMERIKSWFTG